MKETSKLLHLEQNYKNVSCHLNGGKKTTDIIGGIIVGILCAKLARIFTEEMLR